MKRYFLLEEPSMELFLRDLLKRLFPHWREERDFFLRPHQGKSDLQGAIPRFIKAASANSGMAVIIIHDQDMENCKQLKRNLQGLCRNAAIPVLIRIVCRELEAWYLGDPNALAKVYEKFKKVRNKSIFKGDPDTIKKPSALLMKHVRDFNKNSAARQMGKDIDIMGNISSSFQCLISGLQNFCA